MWLPLLVFTLFAFSNGHVGDEGFATLFCTKLLLRLFRLEIFAVNSTQC